MVLAELEQEPRLVRLPDARGIACAVTRRERGDDETVDGLRELSYALPLLTGEEPLEPGGGGGPGRPAGAIGAYLGSVTTNRVPAPGVLLTSMRPPCSSTERATIANPRPVPAMLPTLPARRKVS